MHDLPLPQELDGIPHIGVVTEAEDVVVGHAGLLLCCNCISTTFLEIPMNFYGNITRTGNPFPDGYMINQRFHDFAR